MPSSSTFQFKASPTKSANWILKSFYYYTMYYYYLFSFSSVGLVFQWPSPLKDGLWVLFAEIFYRSPAQHHRH